MTCLIENKHLQLKRGKNKERKKKLKEGVKEGKEEER